jgi:hypothetical protein
MIQGSINQLLSMAAMAQRLSPEFETKQARVQTEQQLKGLQKQTKAWDFTKEETIGQIEAANSVVDDVVAASKKAFAVNPNEETFGRYMTNVKESEAFKKKGDERIKEILNKEEEYKKAQREAEAAQKIRQLELTKVRESQIKLGDNK